MPTRSDTSSRGPDGGSPPAARAIGRNEQVADKLAEAADILSAQDADPFRVSAYRRAGETVRGLGRDVAAIAAEGGIEALDALPGIGRSIAGAIMQMVGTGRWPFLDELRGAADPVALFRAIPGIGPTLARRIHAELGVDTLEQLELAAHDGRLSALAGVGPRRARMVRSALSDMLSRVRPRDPPPGALPGVDVLLDVDREYRERAASLPRIAPRRFNPKREAWLPVLHTRRGDFDLTALFSNTARAHQLGRERDWVVIFFHADGPDAQCTVVTETRGPLNGRRVVRGRERECERHYREGAPGTGGAVPGRGA